MKGLLWNIRKNPQAVRELLNQNKSIDPNVLFLTETGKPEDADRELASEWECVGYRYFDNDNSLSVWRKKYSEVLKDDFILVEDKLQSFRALVFIYKFSCLFVLVHLPSKLKNNEINFAYAAELNREIRMFEKAIFSGRSASPTIILGDFNANVHEPLMMHPLTFNTPYARATFFTGDKSYYSSGGRTLRKDLSYPTFFNKMWQLVGLANANLNQPQGTYNHPAENYKDLSNHFKDDLMRYQYNFFDHVLVRPDLIDNFAELQIPEIPLAENMLVSDHRPVYFELKNLEHFPDLQNRNIKE